MLTLFLAAPLALSLNTIVFNNGQTNIITQNDVSPSDNIIVRGRGPNMNIPTVVSARDAAHFASLTLERQSSGNLLDNSFVEGDVLVSGDCSLSLLNNASVAGNVLLEPGSLTTINTSGTIGGDLRIQTQLPPFFALQAQIDGDLVVEQGGAIGAASVQGQTSVTGDKLLSFAGTQFFGGLMVQGSSDVRLLNANSPATTTFGGNSIVGVESSEMSGMITVQDSAQVRFASNNSINATVQLVDQAEVFVLMETANVPEGLVTVPAGVIVGTNPDGSFYSLAFQREPGTRLTVVTDLSTPVGTTVCTQSLPNSTGAVAHVEAFGSDFAGANTLTLRMTDMPLNSFAFFFMGTEPGLVTLSTGEICVGGDIGRFQFLITNSGPTGMISIPVDLPTLPGSNASFAAMAGDTLHFQGWIRDIVTLPTFRFSDALAVQLR